MNRPLRLAAIAIVSFLPTHVHASEFRDFRIPDHTWSTGSVTLTGSGYRSRTNTEQSHKTLELRGSLSGDVSIARETDPWQAFLRLDASGFGSGREETVHAHDALFDSEVEQRRNFEWLGAVAELRAYPGGGPFGISVRGASTHMFSQIEVEERVRNAAVPSFSEIADEQRHFQEYLRGDLTFGLGRVRNATGVYQVWLLERRWLETGALRRHLSPEARQRLAELFYLQGTFANVHDRSDKRFWHEVENIFREDGALSDDGLNAYSVLRALEWPHETTPLFVRRVGWFAGPVAGVGAQLNHLRQSTRSTLVDPSGFPITTDVENQTRAYEDFFSAGARAEAFVPIGMQGQLDVESEVRHITTETRFQPSDQESVEMSSTLAYTHLWNERWALQGFANHTRSISALDTDLERSTWWVGYGVDLGFFLEDHLYMGLAVREWQYRSPNFAPLGYHRSGEVFLGLTYQFLGFLDAPGLVRTSRMRAVAGPD